MGEDRIIRCLDCQTFVWAGNYDPENPAENTRLYPPTVVAFIDDHRGHSVQLLGEYGEQTAYHATHRRFSNEVDTDDDQYGEITNMMFIPRALSSIEIEELWTYWQAERATDDP